MSDSWPPANDDVFVSECRVLPICDGAIVALRRPSEPAVTIREKIMRSLLPNEVLLGSAAALAIKFAGSVLGFVMFALCARHMDPASFGSLAVTFNAMSFLAVFALCGQQTLIVRSWDEYIASDRPGYARGAFTFSLRIIVVAVTLMVAVVALGWPLWDRHVAPSLLIAACAFLFAQAFMHFSAQFSRVAAGIVVGELPREILWRLVVIIAIGIYHLHHVDLTATKFFAISAVALLLSLCIQAWFVMRAVPDSVREAKSQTKPTAWISRSSSMWASAVLDTTSQYLEVVVISYVLGPTAAAFCFVATRITAIFPMIAGAITGYAMSLISRLFYAGAKEDLRGVLHSLAVISALLTGSALLAIAVTGKLLLATFGPIYVEVFPALIVLAAGTAATALSGPAAYLLLLTGNERIYPRILAWALMGRFILLAGLGYWFGLMGAVVALSVSSIVMSIALVLACRRLVGLDPSLLGGFCSSFPRWPGRPPPV